MNQHGQGVMELWGQGQEGKAGSLHKHRPGKATMAGPDLEGLWLEEVPAML